MHPFSYTKVSSTHDALADGERGGRYIAGGTTLVDLMRQAVERPSRLVDISALPLRQVTPTARGGLRIGALTTHAEIAASRSPAVALPSHSKYSRCIASL